eukprot:TRINITY_DN7788_c0_g1_i1.p1 TRINITY_DN7788_c0_g1~~TRINITY_DN7788_c0_g1_i1.p1  ORF type:complete len:381 (+),score=42.19 TRINITY_DN7788_c0_g1_i1:104-1246(+)
MEDEEPDRLQRVVGHRGILLGMAPWFMPKRVREQREQVRMQAARSREELPWIVVKRFTIFMIVLWVFTTMHFGFSHAYNYDRSQEPKPDAKAGLLKNVSGTTKQPDDLAADKSKLPGHSLQYTARTWEVVFAEWPPPAGFFEIHDISCNASSVIIGGRFAIYEAGRPTRLSLKRLTKLWTFGTVCLLCSSGQECGAFFKEGSRWNFAPNLQLDEKSTKVFKAPLPTEWLLLDAIRIPSSPKQNESIRIVGWDGALIVVATLRQTPLVSQWHLERHFALHPGLGQSAMKADFRLGSLETYEDVRAMHLGNGGQLLMVLLGSGTLDGWDLTTGEHLGRWSVGSGYTAMCHDDRDLMFARHGTKGPSITLTELPSVLRENSQR